MTVAEQQSEQASVSSDAATIAITGATGLVGNALKGVLQDAGHQILSITRGSREQIDNAVLWDPSSGLVNPAKLEGTKAVVHLAGESIAAGRWNDSLKARIRNSRVEGTRNLVQSLNSLEKRPEVLVCASATGFYGDQGERVLSEGSQGGEGFLADVCREWEEAALEAEALGIRVVRVRIGVVLTPKGGALQKMLLPFRLGLGGKVGSGKQYWSWIGLHDLVRILQFAATSADCPPVVNAVAPEAATNLDFTKALGRVLRRPVLFPLPAFMAKLVLGEMADALLLASTRVEPEALQKAGFRFDYPELEGCLRNELA